MASMVTTPRRIGSRITHLVPWLVLPTIGDPQERAGDVLRDDTLLPCTMDSSSAGPRR